MKQVFVSTFISNKLNTRKKGRKKAILPEPLNIRILMFRKDQKKIAEILKKHSYYRKNYYKLFVKLDRQYTQELSLEDMQRVTGKTYKRLCSDFKEITNTTPGDYLIILKTYKAAYLLLNSTLSINDITYECGFSTPSHFRSLIKRYFGMSPTKYRAQKTE